MSARPQVTITLGRGGCQVVKRARSVCSEDNSPYSGGKQQLRERSEKSMVNSDTYGNMYVNKRQRREANGSSLDDKILVDMHTQSNRHIGRGDLRLKLLKKYSSRVRDTTAEGPCAIDLRQKLSRKRHVPSRYHAQEYVRESYTSDMVQHSPPTRRMPPARSGDRRMPPTRSADDLRQFDSERRSYSLWALEGQRHRSPDRLLSTSKRYEDLRTAPSMRSVHAYRSLSSMTNSLNDASRSVPFTRKTAAAVGAAKPVARAPLPRAVAERSFLVSDEPLTIEKMLHSLDLDKYHVIFKAEEVDITALSQMGDNDLKEMGIPMGPRKKILLAALSHMKQQRR